MIQESHKLSVLEKIGYAFGDGASNLIWMTFIYFQLNFYTDVFGLAAGALGLMLLITRTWDMFFDVFIGTIADRTHTRWGKFRPYLLWMAVPFGIMSVASFTTPSFGPAGKLVYAYVTLSLMMVVYSAINVPYSALMGVISPDSQQRTSLSSWRFTFAFLGGLVVQFSTLRMVEFFGKGNQALGYQLTLGVYAVAAVVLFLVTFATTRERVQPVADQKTSRTRDVKDLLTNVPWLVLCALGILTVCFVAIRGAAIVYYFKYYVRDARGAASFMVVGSIMSVLGTFLIQYVTPFTGRKKAYMGCMLLAAATLVFSYWLRPDQLVLLYAYNIAYCLLTGPTSALLWAMFADTADYSEWRKGRRATGLIYSASGMSNKFGWVIGGALVALLLDRYGYQANVAQTAEGQHGIRLLMAIAPAVGAMLAGMGMFFYRLNETTMQKIQGELAVIRAK
ncbi:MAG: MFS transporter [Bryobacteraceae bacterium]|jgi:GPH family glycoside/pentoside/hexuronide:cation symporter